MNYSFNVQMGTVKEYSGFNKSQGQSNKYYYSFCYCYFFYTKVGYSGNTYNGSEWGWYVNIILHTV